MSSSRDMMIAHDAPQGFLAELAARVNVLARANHRVRGGQVHVIDTMHPFSTWLGPTYFCGLGHADDDEMTGDEVTCGNCVRAILTRRSN